ncbi:class D beta-lactamase [Ancylomarina longa]|uniref:Beta-lactamase n=1 Tax=Ancylomarina longa TaxID=2487017 RepID=A0A434AEP4_9BACT|nr:class D beta-lactamase [Ancylomarina longa]RUT72836.1 class D beta-lactamase [Ancylomarina longa]
MRRSLLSSLLILLSVLALKAQGKNSNERWKTIFEKYNINGTFVLYNTSSGESQFFNEERSDSTFLPASTFKILNSLIALETKAVSSVDDTIKWDGLDKGWEKWNKDQSMKTAMPLSCVWFYQKLARRIGAKNMHKWMLRVGYGNTKMGGRIDNFWLEGDLRISAKDQVKFIERLINNDLPFSLENQQAVKDLMITDATDNYVLHSKTGWAMRIANQIGWFVGYVSSKEGTWIFALNMDLNTKSDAKYRKQISYDILKEEGIID